MTTSTTAATTTTGRPKSTGRQPSEQAIDAAIDSATRLLRLPTFRDRYAEIADAAGREQLSYRAFLSELLLAECDDREERRAARRVQEAGFPRPKTLAEFDFAANTAINPATINTLAGCGWVSKGQSLCLIGDSGTGKSHLLIGLGTAAAQAGHRVRYALAAKLVNELVEAADERQLSRTIARYGRVELLCLDELGYMELDKRGAEYPAEHNVGHLYNAKPALVCHYKCLDPCNCFNPGIGRTSKYMHWRGNHHDELLDGGSAAETRGMESSHPGSAVKIRRANRAKARPGPA